MAALASNNFVQETIKHWKHNLKQSDLRQIGSQGVISEILKGKRQLNLSQIKKLAEMFQVSINTFID